VYRRGIFHTRGVLLTAFTESKGRDTKRTEKNKGKIQETEINAKARHKHQVSWNFGRKNTNGKLCRKTKRNVRGDRGSARAKGSTSLDAAKASQK